MKYFYARVGSDSQKADLQCTVLRKVSCHRYAGWPHLRQWGGVSC